MLWLEFSLSSILLCLCPGCITKSLLPLHTNGRRYTTRGPTFRSTRVCANGRVVPMPVVSRVLVSLPLGPGEDATAAAPSKIVSPETIFTFFLHLEAARRMLARQVTCFR